MPNPHMTKNITENKSANDVFNKLPLRKTYKTRQKPCESFCLLPHSSRPISPGLLSFGVTLQRLHFPRNSRYETNAVYFDKFMLAFKSLSILIPQASHLNVRSDHFNDFFKYPHELHIFEDGYHWLASINSMPYASHLCFSFCLKAYRRCCCIAFDQWRFFIIPLMFRSSIMIRAGLVLTSSFDPFS
jgi:hypothetical protein